jgi:hypothetical protein
LRLDRELFGLPFLDPAVEQRGAIAVAQVIEREVDARCQQDRIFTIDHYPPRIPDAELFKDFLQIGHGGQFVRDAVARGQYLFRREESRPGDVAVVEMFALGGDVDHEDIPVVEALRQPIGRDQHFRANLRLVVLRLAFRGNERLCAEKRR